MADLTSGNLLVGHNDLGQPMWVLRYTPQWQTPIHTIIWHIEKDTVVKSH